MVHYYSNTLNFLPPSSGSYSTSGLFQNGAPFQPTANPLIEWVYSLYPNVTARMYIPWDYEDLQYYGGSSLSTRTQEMVWPGVVNGHNATGGAIGNPPVTVPTNTLALAGYHAPYPGAPKAVGIRLNVTGVWQLRVRITVKADLTNTTGRNATNTPPVGRSWRGRSHVDYNNAWNEKEMKYQVRLYLQEVGSFSSPAVTRAEVVETFECDECEYTVSLTTNVLVTSQGQQFAPQWSASIAGVRLLASCNEFSGELISAS